MSIRIHTFYRILGKHQAKIQGVTPWPILRIFFPMMIIKKLHFVSTKQRGQN